MKRHRNVLEDLTFKSAELDAALREAGFHLAYADPEAARDFSYRARYIRGRSTLFPLLNASVEYYCATAAFTLKIGATDEQENGIYGFLVKQYDGSLKELLDRYFVSVRRGIPCLPDRGT